MKKAVALLVNDLHVSKDNIAEFNKNWDEALSICLDRKIKSIIIGGDVFTSRASQTLSTLMAVRNAFNKAIVSGIEIMIAEGNHDKVDLESNIGYNHLWESAYIIPVDYYESLPLSENWILIVMSYFPEKDVFVRKLEGAVASTLQEYPNLRREDIILYIHEGVEGALGTIQNDKEVPQKHLKGFKSVLCGHYHNRTKIKGTNIEYIGASRQHNFGEDEEKGYTILYLDGTYEFIKNSVNIRYKTVEISASKSLSDFIAKDNYRYKLKVRCNEKQAKNFDKQFYLNLGFDKVEIISESTTTEPVAHESISEKYDSDGIKREYQTYCEENQINSELGLKYLDENYVVSEKNND